MIEWINQHPWMTFILGIISLTTINSFFVSIGGGYKKFPRCNCQPKVDIDTPKSTEDKNN